MHYIIDAQPHRQLCEPLNLFSVGTRCTTDNVDHQLFTHHRRVLHELYRSAYQYLRTLMRLDTSDKGDDQCILWNTDLSARAYATITWGK